jgi:hypothetical protein
VYARVAFYATYKDTAMFIQGLNTIIENEEYGTIVERNAYGIDLQHCDRIIAKTNIFEMNCAFIAVSDIERGTRGVNAIDGSYFTIKITHEGFHKGMLLKCNKLPVYYTTTETRAEERITHTGSDAYIEIRILYSRISAQASTENEYKFVGWYRDSGIEYIVTLAEPVQLQLVDDPLVIPTSGTKYTTIMAPITAALDVTEFTAGKDGKYVVLKDESNEGLFPMTYADVVMMSDGQTVEEKIRHILSLLESN